MNFAMYALTIAVAPPHFMDMPTKVVTPCQGHPPTGRPRRAGPCPPALAHPGSLLSHMCNQPLVPSHTTHHYPPSARLRRAGPAPPHRLSTPTSIPGPAGSLPRALAPSHTRTHHYPPPGRPCHAVPAPPHYLFYLLVAPCSPTRIPTIWLAASCCPCSTRHAALASWQAATSRWPRGPHAGPSPPPPAAPSAASLGTSRVTRSTLSLVTLTKEACAEQGKYMCYACSYWRWPRGRGVGPSPPPPAAAALIMASLEVGTTRSGRNIVLVFLLPNGGV